MLAIEYIVLLIITTTAAIVGMKQRPTIRTAAVITIVVCTCTGILLTLISPRH